jgi:S1-C subfamily serine protease
MKRLLALLAFAALPAVAEPPAGDRPRLLAEFEDEIIGLAERARPSLVQIAAHFRFEDDDDENGEGYVANEYSGVVISAEGHVVTVASAVRGAKKVEVILNDGVEYSAEILGVDEVTNLALVRIDPAETKLTPAVFADSDAVRPGAFVLTLGNPYGMKASLQHGIVSGTRRTVGGGLATHFGLIQINAPINPGDGGGLAVNSRGEVIGILTSTFQRATALDDFEALLDELREGMDWEEFRKKLNEKSENASEMPRDLLDYFRKLVEKRQKAQNKRNRANVRIGAQALGAEGINFITPSNVVRRVAEDLKSKGRVDRGFLGIFVEPADQALRKHLGLAAGRGVVVVGVTPKSPAAEAGLERFDVILSIDGVDVDGVDRVAASVMGKTAGESVALRVLRGKVEVEIKATLAPLKK